jgi:hypothetical protein
MIDLMLQAKLFNEILLQLKNYFSERQIADCEVEIETMPCPKPEESKVDFDSRDWQRFLKKKGFTKVLPEDRPKMEFLKFALAHVTKWRDICCFTACKSPTCTHCAALPTESCPNLLSLFGQRPIFPHSFGENHFTTFIQEWQKKDRYWFFKLFLVTDSVGKL